MVSALMGNRLFAGCTSENSLTCNSIQVKCKLSLCRIYPMLDSLPACSSEQMIGLRLKSFGGCRVTSFRGRPFPNDLSSSGVSDSSTHFDEKLQQDLKNDILCKNVSEIVAAVATLKTYFYSIESFGRVVTSHLTI